MPANRTMTGTRKTSGCGATAGPPKAPKQGIQGHGAADGFGNDGGTSHDLGLGPVPSPSGHPKPPREEFGEAQTRRRPRLRRLVMHQDGHGIGNDENPDEQVAEIRPRRQIRRRFPDPRSQSRPRPLRAIAAAGPPPWRAPGDSRSVEVAMGFLRAERRRRPPHFATRI